MIESQAFYNNLQSYLIFDHWNSTRNFGNKNTCYFDLRTKAKLYRWVNKSNDNKNYLVESNHVLEFMTLLFYLMHMYIDFACNSIYGKAVKLCGAIAYLAWNIKATCCKQSMIRIENL